MGTLSKTYLGLGGALLLLALLYGGAYLGEQGFGFFRISLEERAREVIETCRTDSYPPRCYDVEIPKLMDEGLSLEEAFAVTKIIQANVDDYFYCHVLGHNLSAKETAKDPSEWTSVIARCPTGMCSNGCLHGAAQERFRDEVLTDEQIESVMGQLSTICEGGAGRDYTGLEQGSCYHSLGHLAMYLTGARVDAATGVCDRVAVQEDGNDDYVRVCYEGVYMQIYQPLEPEDFGLVKDIAPTSATDAKRYCDSFSGERRAACHRESWPLSRAQVMTAPGLEAFCSLVPEPVSKARCYGGMFYVLAAQFTFDEKRITALCSELPEKRKAQCYANSASRFIETDYQLIGSAIALCQKADAEGVGTRCYDELLFYSSYNFHPDSEAFKTLCAALPEPWGGKCFRQEDTKLSPSSEDV